MSDFGPGGLGSILSWDIRDEHFSPVTDIYNGPFQIRRKDPFVNKGLKLERGGSVIEC